MKVADALLKRQSIRAFTDQSVSKEQITKILDVARYANVSSNALSNELTLESLHL